MEPVRAFTRRMAQQSPIVLVLAGAIVLIMVFAASSAINRSRQTVDAPAAADNLDAQTIPASGVPPEDGGQADIIPPDEGGDDQSAVAPATTNTTAPPAP